MPKRSLSAYLQLHPDELNKGDLDGDSQQEDLQKNYKTQSAIRKLKKLVRLVEPILHDLVEGNIKRVRPSSYPDSSTTPVPATSISSTDGPIQEKDEEE